VTRGLGSEHHTQGDGRHPRVEQTEAAAAVGVTDIAFLGYPDGRLMPSIELRRDITRVIREKQPSA